MAALEAVYEGTNEALVDGRIDWAGVTGRGKEVGVGGGLGRGGDAVEGAQSCDVAFYRVGDAAIVGFGYGLS